MSLLSCRGLDVDIDDLIICRQLDLDIQTGERWALLGRNGIGKTTLLHTLAGLRPYSGGSIEILGIPLAQQSARELAKRRGILLQQQEDAFPSTVLETALIGRHPYLSPWQWESDEDRQLALAALEAMALTPLQARQIQTLSGGERQRLAMATLITQDPPLLLLDEPTNHLDLHHQLSLLGRLQRWSTESEKGAIMTLHDVNLAARFCDHALLLYGDGKVISGTTAEVLTVENLEALYLHPLESIERSWGQAFLPR